ncbi:MAG: carboxypeptidase regulatory-like domain-containing protein [Deltaproteobacteria bacterium]|nr:carboxypeptidase regulatory-like domain-containing protein [Deltaproteobacteria bacterium]
MRLERLAAPLLATLLWACSSSSHPTCDPASPTSCPAGRVCETVSGAPPACVPPLVIRGTVRDLASGAAVAGARVVALDQNRAPASAVATTAADGTYALEVPAARDGSGAPAAAGVTLRADADGYQSFPGGVRTALPIDLATAAYASGAGRWELSGSLTQVGLIALPADATRARIHGTVAVPPSRVGVLVVAEQGGVGRAVIADRNGGYVIFNLPVPADPTPYRVEAYAQGVQFAPVNVDLSPGGDGQANLAISGAAAIGFGGNLIYNNGVGPPTQVALAVASTYLASLDRGETPPGLVARVATGSTYAFQGVPDGTYRVLASFDVDGAVRDVSGGGNTDSPTVTVSGGAVQGAVPGFKLCGAVDLTSIDGQTSLGTAPVALTHAAPAFVWQRQSTYASAAYYRIQVIDALGQPTWEVEQAATAGTNQVTYAGPALAPGMYYQLRIQALDGASSDPLTVQLSQTEDLKGVFTLP